MAIETNSADYYRQFTHPERYYPVPDPDSKVKSRFVKGYEMSDEQVISWAKIRCSVEGCGIEYWRHGTCCGESNAIQIIQGAKSGMGVTVQVHAPHHPFFNCQGQVRIHPAIEPIHHQVPERQPLWTPESEAQYKEGVEILHTSPPCINFSKQDDSHRTLMLLEILSSETIKMIAQDLYDAANAKGISPRATHLFKHCMVEYRKRTGDFPEITYKPIG